MFDKEKFIEFILENKVIGFSNKPIEIGNKETYWYVDWKRVIRDLSLIKKLADFIIDFAEDLKIDFECFYGTGKASTVLATITQYRWAERRERSLEFGPGKYFFPVGRPLPIERTILLEDSVMIGNSAIKEIERLKRLNVDIVAFFLLIDRMETFREDKKSMREIVESYGIPYYSLTNAIEVLPRLYKESNASVEIAKAIEDEFKEYGIKGIELKLI